MLNIHKSATDVATGAAKSKNDTFEFISLSLQTNNERTDTICKVVAYAQYNCMFKLHGRTTRDNRLSNTCDHVAIKRGRFRIDLRRREVCCDIHNGAVIIMMAQPTMQGVLINIETAAAKRPRRLATF